MQLKVRVVGCLILIILGLVLMEQSEKANYYTVEVTLCKTKGFRVLIADARDIRQLHIFWNYRKPYNRSNPYSTTDYTNVTFNENFRRTLVVADNDIQLRVGDSIFYWLLLVTKEWERITLHKQNFWVKLDKTIWQGVPEPFAETYYRDYDNCNRHDEI